MNLKVVSDMRKKVCLIFNLGPIYRERIYKLIDTEFNADFYLGKTSEMKLMNYDELKGFKGSLENHYLFKDFYWQRGIFNISLKNYDAFIINGEPYNLTNWYILFYAFFNSKKVYTWGHGWYGRESFVKVIIKKFFHNLATHNFLYGNYARDLMIEKGVRADKLSVIYNSLDYEKQLIYRDKTSERNPYKDRFANDLKNIIFFGRLTKSKRVDLVLDAVRLLKAQGFNLNLTVIGLGVEYDNLVEKAKSLGIEDCVWFYGDCYDEEQISTLFHYADMLVSPGNVGLNAVHSFAYGLPVLTHDDFKYQNPEFEIITEGVTGTFYNHDNLSSLADSLRTWFEINHDREVIRSKCFATVDGKYNPNFQIAHLKSHIQTKPNDTNNGWRKHWGWFAAGLILLYLLFEELVAMSFLEAI